MISQYIDHTALKPTTTAADIERLCAEAVEHHFAAVCVPPANVLQAAELLRNSGVAVATVVGFPLGYSTTQTKLWETTEALKAGATEIDMVQNLGWVKGGNWKQLREEGAALVERTHAGGGLLKMILETALLTDAEIAACCELYGALGTDFVKTSTGFAEGGATVEAVTLMRRSLPAGVQIKAAGGIRTFAQAQALLAAGATRLGASAGVALTAEERTFTQSL